MKFPDLPLNFGDDRDAINFEAQDVELPTLLARHSSSLARWLRAVAKTYRKSVNSLTYVLCDDDYLHAMNVERLGHDTLTDIITFDLADGDPGDALDGECYVSLPRVFENAVAFGASDVDRRQSGDLGLGPGSVAETELLRVLAHGLLHLCGLGDKTDEEAQKMRDAEDRALYIWRSRFASTQDRH